MINLDTYKAAKDIAETMFRLDSAGHPTKSMGSMNIADAVCGHGQRDTTNWDMANAGAALVIGDHEVVIDKDGYLVTKE